MAYANKLVAAVKCNGKVLREFGDTVKLPFGSEYSILIKNLNTKRAQVNVYIDGALAADNLVLNAGSELDLQRFLTGNNLSQGNAFKFIERTDGIEQHRGVGLEDGLIRIEWQYEDTSYYRPQWTVNTSTPWNNGGYNPNTGTPLYGTLNTVTAGGLAGSSGATASILRGGAHSVSTCSLNSTPISAQAMNCSTTAAFVNDAGITAKGSINNQQFRTVAGFPLEVEKHSLVLRLAGYSGTETVKEAVTVKHVPVCENCGRKNRATSKFCSDCGTSLERAA